MSDTPQETPLNAQLLDQLYLLQTQITQLEDSFVYPETELADLHHQAAEIHEQLQFIAESGQNQNHDEWESDIQNDYQNAANEHADPDISPPPYQEVVEMDRLEYLRLEFDEGSDIPIAAAHTSFDAQRRDTGDMEQDYDSSYANSHDDFSHDAYSQGSANNGSWRSTESHHVTEPNINQDPQAYNYGDSHPPAGQNDRNNTNTPYRYQLQTSDYMFFTFLIMFLIFPFGWVAWLSCHRMC
ncbi:hypothetical protein GLAREA_09408 [Glarea lozoyensis ATCC 20868]|uniref:Uncharacterized protein n=1 Tax=Glarea lozoyensis (strain ATCC 20868 / MF5171) TaxID=1116229 RepID=S3DPC9_GLAL2|nr:uncharacterized protein GLAREA_09408 [Glarea lozoyensis ATCC 20868]EPE28288.1 hypothetical protein GLAREA_09408 [Glarea lozoyensis ATCC 20868]